MALTSEDHNSAVTGTLIWPALNELEVECLRLGAEQHRYLEDGSQISAFLLLAVRCLSLLRAMLRLLEPDFLDAYDTVRRSFLEAWLLQFEFRLQARSEQATRWLSGDKDAWKPNFKVVEAFFSAVGGEKGGFAHFWGDLSELAHPTRQACVNSCAIATTMRNINPSKEVLLASMEKLTEDYLGLVHWQLLATLFEHTELIDLRFDKNNLTTCQRLYAALAKETESSGAKLAQASKT